MTSIELPSIWSVLVWIAEWAVVVLLVAVVVIVLGTVRLRRKSMRVRPKAGEVWMQDGSPIYVRAVAPHGLMLMAHTTAGPHTWWDSWDEWGTRVRSRTVIRTNQTIIVSEQN